MDNTTQRIKLIMKYFSLNRLKFSEKIGIQVTTLNHILNGRNNASLSVILNICNAYPEINPGWLLMGRGEMFSESNTSKVIEKRYSRKSVISLKLKKYLITYMSIRRFKSNQIQIIE